MLRVHDVGVMLEAVAVAHALSSLSTPESPETPETPEIPELPEQPFGGGGAPADEHDHPDGFRTPPPNSRP
jgi:hypothetical protein